MIDLTVRDLTKAEDEDGAIDFISLTNPQWEMIKVNIDLLKNHEKCELMYTEDFLKIIAKERTDAIDDAKEYIHKAIAHDGRNGWSAETWEQYIMVCLEQLKEQNDV